MQNIPRTFILVNPGWWVHDLWIAMSIFHCDNSAQSRAVFHGFSFQTFQANPALKKRG